MSTYWPKPRAVEALSPAAGLTGATTLKPPTADLAAIDALTPTVLSFLSDHRPESAGRMTDTALSGDFALYRAQPDWDLYGAIDAAYCLYTIGKLQDVTTPASRRKWQQRILSCQDEDGWFRLRNRRGHGVEHATAYALGALTLLQDPDTPGLADIELRPIEHLRPLCESREATAAWLSKLGFTSWRGAMKKNVGWHYVWRSSHIGGGIAAAMLMLGDRPQQWWPGVSDRDTWLGWYFDWLDAEVNLNTGLWQRAFWNIAYKRPTLIDLGGAVHFYWIYAAAGRALPAPAPLIKATLSLQKPTGLYKEHPFCIDLDANFCLVRPWEQLSPPDAAKWAPSVQASLTRNVTAITGTLGTRPFAEIYQDSHGLPGALAALTEAARMPALNLPLKQIGWQHVLDRVPWL